MYETQYETPSQTILNLAAAVRELEAAGRTRRGSIGLDRARYEADQLCAVIRRLHQETWPDTEVQTQKASR